MGTGGRINPHTVTYMETACPYNLDFPVHPFAFRAHAHSLGKLYAHVLGFTCFFYNNSMGVIDILNAQYKHNYSYTKWECSCIMIFKYTLDVKLVQLFVTYQAKHDNRHDVITNDKQDIVCE